MNEKVTTRDRILDSALTLFSEKGYDGVGVDLIAERAGLKGPSIYKHFKSKEEILDVLIENVEDYYTQNFGSQMNLGRIPTTAEQLIAGALGRIQFTLYDDTIVKTRKILTMEQFRNARIAKLATLHNLDAISAMYQKIFACMMEEGTIRQSDAGMLATAFVSPITVLIQVCDREPWRMQEMVEQMKDYMTYFAQNFLQFV